MNKKIDFKNKHYNYCTIANMSSSARDVKFVIQRLLEVIPEDQTLLREKIVEFNDTTIKTTAPRHKEMWNQAPELMNGIYFQELGYILEENTGEIDTDWKRTMVKVFANQE